MKSFKSRYYIIFLAGLLTLGTSSCTDWLTIYPQNRVVEENFWEDKNDLEGVRYGAYRQMAQTVSKLAIWGDLRADSYELNGAIQSDMETHNRYIDIINGMPDSSMSEFDWEGVYKTIGFCNKVLNHGDEILAKDKQFTTAEWYQMRAEMTALRALNYFYLIRAFKDVPYTTKEIKSDSQVESFTLKNQLEVLDSIILDCERVKGYARTRFTNKQDSKGMITNCAIYAMLADMYLWRASLHEGRHDKNTRDVIIIDGAEVSYSIADDYNSAIENAKLSLMSLAEQNREERASAGLSGSNIETFDYGLGNNCDMIKNDFTTALTSVPELEAQTSIFGDGDKQGNSRESIFELQYRTSDGLSNSIVNSLYGFSRGTHLQVNKSALDRIYEGGIGGDAANGGMWDSRIWVCCQNKLIAKGEENSGVQAQAGYYCMKYQLPNKDFLTMESSGSDHTIKSLNYTSTSHNNWIIYRMTDVMLIWAEALACQNTTKTNDQARAICNAIHRRSYCNYQSNVTPDQDATKGTVGNPLPSGKEDTKADNDVKIPASVMYVMNERQIELIGEGKRWFDLVRLAERCSYQKSSSDPDDPREAGVKDGKSGMEAMIKVFLGAGSNSGFASTLVNRFKNRYGLYCPIYYMEVKASNGNIQQNPVWNKSKYEQ